MDFLQIEHKKSKASCKSWSPKTQLLLFCFARQHHNPIPNTNLKKFVLETVKSVAYLGIEIDETLSWNKQTENLCKKTWYINKWYII